MKKITLLWILLGMGLTASAQYAPRYLTLEHFTNTRCSICPSRNATLFNTLDANPGLIHHLAIHPSVPYNSCVFYQHNTTENDARKTLYSIAGTPQAFVWGEKVWQGSTLLSQEKIDDRIGQTAVIGLKVNESEMGGTRNVTVDIRSYAAAPAGNWKLFVAVVERHIAYNAPNGESDHRNVFRDFLDNGDGVDITLPSAGSTESFSFNYAIDAEWNADEIYVMAFVQELDSREILNSGTSTDLQAELLATPASNGNDGTASAQVNGGLPPYTITWDDPASTTGALAQNLTPGTYTATITDAHGITLADTVEVAGTVSIDPALLAAFKIYVDQAGKQLQVMLPPAAGGALQLFDLQGRVIGLPQQLSPNQAQAQISTQGLSKGLYVLTWANDTGVRLHRKVQIR